MQKPIQFEFEGKKYSIGFESEGLNRSFVTPQEHYFIGSGLDLPEDTQPKDWLKPYGLLKMTRGLEETIREREKHGVLASALMAGVVDSDFNSMLVFKLSPLNKYGEAEASPKIIGRFNDETREFAPYTHDESERTMELFLSNLAKENEGEGKDFFASLELFQDQPRSGVEKE